MTYPVETSGQLLLPEPLERQALTVLEVELVGRQGPLADVDAVDTLADLATAAGAAVRREGDWLQVTTAGGVDHSWSDQATGFYVGLARWVTEGEVHLVGPDGARWSYRYGPDGVIQVGQNGWDGSLVPFGEPVPATPGRAGAGAPPRGFQQPVEPQQSGGRAVAMTLLLIVGVLLIIGIAMLGAGLAG
jgi:hypothetical protein